MILHLNNAKTWRGGEQQVYYLVKGLKERGIPQIVAGYPNSELEKRINGLAPFFPVKMRGEVDVFAVRKLSKIVKEQNVSIVHTHTAKTHSIGLMLKKFHPDLKLVVSRRVDFHINKNVFSRKKYFSELNNYFLTVSNKIKEILIEDGVDPEKVVTVYSGIDLEKFKEKPDVNKLKAEFKLDENTITIGNVAALVDHKDQRTLLKAVAEVKTDKKYLFFILGSGELEAELKGLASELKIEDRVVFTGFRNDVRDFYALFDIFTLTSKEEGLGTSVLDAMANKLPIIATRGGGISEMLDHEQGALLAEIGDFKTLAGYYTRLIENQSLRKRFGNYNLKSVEKFSVENTINKTLQIYRALNPGL